MKRAGSVLLLLAAFAGAAFARVGGGDFQMSAKGAGPVTFSHERHVTGASPVCTDCHAALYVTREKHVPVTMAQMRKGKSCGACHDGRKAFDVKANCDRCHARQGGEPR